MDDSPVVVGDACALSCGPGCSCIPGWDDDACLCGVQGLDGLDADADARDSSDSGSDGEFKSAGVVGAVDDGDVLEPATEADVDVGAVS